jgi:predicted RNA-binding Zn ribbon-like protein
MGKEKTKDWVDGFLFVGNHPALDLLNTRLVNEEGPVEQLPDVDALVRWLTASGIVADPAAGSAVRGWKNARSGREFLRRLLLFREELRAAVVRFASGKSPDSFLRSLNTLLVAHPRRYLLKRGNDGFQRELFLDLTTPHDLWSVFAGQAADLFADIPYARVRKCEGCVVNFYDTSKKGSRRWCSMNMCGNREKVTTYRHKRRATR